MKFLKLCFCSALLSNLISCSETDIDWSEYSEGTTTSSTKKSSIPDSLPLGTQLNFNPEITIGEELTPGKTVESRYVNSNSASQFPFASETISVTLTKVNDYLELNFEISNKNILLKLNNFVDFGDDGFFDEFDIEAIIDGENKDKSFGRFIGPTKPENRTVKNTINVNRAPTDEEFLTNLVEKPIQIKELYPEPRDGFLILHTNSKITRYILANDEDNIPSDESWKYEYNNGNPRLIIHNRHTHESNSNPDHYHQSSTPLHFFSFYDGTYGGDGATEEEDGEITVDSELGTWSVLSKIPSGWVPER